MATDLSGYCGIVAMLLVTLTGCGTKVVRVDMDATRLAAAGAQLAPPLLACNYRLGDVSDARTDGGRAGGLSANAFQFTNATDAVRKQLVTAGLSADATAAGPAVNVRIMQLYLAQNRDTKIPVAVYRISVASEPAFVLRSQKASMNWNGSQNEAYAAYALVMADVNQQLVKQLNQRCATN